MPINPRSLKPTELVRLINSTPEGEVLGERQLRRHRARGGYRLGDDRRVDLFRYTGWLFDRRHNPAPKREPRDYQAVKEAARERNAALSAAGRDIGRLPEVVDLDRKAKASDDFCYFCDAYFPMTFDLPWSDDHLKVIAKIEQSVLKGGLFAMAMPRGSGKSTLSECACLWAVLYGHREFVALIGSDEGHAASMLESIKTELDGNDLLLEDFPEVCHPIRSLDGIANRCAGQLCDGCRTHIEWTAKEIVLPTIEGSTASGAVLKVAGITGRIRGMKLKRPDGRPVRPSLVILDDPQTDESARSLSQCDQRERILKHAVLGLAGPGKKIAGVMPCTVIRPGDMADRILDRKIHPQWQGQRTQMVYSFPTNEKLWDEYARIRAEALRNDQGLDPATEFYRQNRDAMDAGAVVAWSARYNYDELSAVQHAMNLKLQDERAFFAEYQNDPLPEEAIDEDDLTIDQVYAKLDRSRRGEVPLGTNHLTMFIDVQRLGLFYVVTAWEDDFTGRVIDYGAYPRQNRDYFTARDMRPTLFETVPGAGLEGAIYAGLEALTGDYLTRQWTRDDGANMRIDRCLIDANWGQSTEVVYRFCHQSAYAGLLYPSHGRYVGASSIPFSEYRRKRGDRVGHNWRVPSITGKRSIRHVVYDTNYWKTFIQARLLTPMGDRGSLTLFGAKPDEHRLFAEHMTAEYHVRTEGRGRTVDEWKIRPERSENHWFDGLVGSAVAASIQGAVLLGQVGPSRARRKPIKLSELQKKRAS